MCSPKSLLLASYGYAGFMNTRWPPPTTVLQTKDCDILTDIRVTHESHITKCLTFFCVVCERELGFMPQNLSREVLLQCVYEIRFYLKFY